MRICGAYRDVFLGFPRVVVYADNSSSDLSQSSSIGVSRINQWWTRDEIIRKMHATDGDNYPL